MFSIVKLVLDNLWLSYSSYSYLVMHWLVWVIMWFWVVCGLPVPVRMSTNSILPVHIKSHTKLPNQARSQNRQTNTLNFLVKLPQTPKTVYENTHCVTKQQGQPSLNFQGKNWWTLKENSPISQIYWNLLSLFFSLT